MPGRVFDSLEETDIEHIVARSEAHDSGLCHADRETRRAFADLIGPFCTKWKEREST